MEGLECLACRKPIPVQRADYCAACITRMRAEVAQGVAQERLAQSGITRQQARERQERANQWPASMRGDRKGECWDEMENHLQAHRHAGQWVEGVSELAQAKRFLELVRKAHRQI